MSYNYLYINKNEVDVLNEMIQFYDEAYNSEDKISPECSEIIGVLRFKIMSFLKDVEDADRTNGETNKDDGGHCS